MSLSSGNVEKYEFLTGKDVLLEKDLLEKAYVVSWKKTDTAKKTTISKIIQVVLTWWSNK